MGTTDILVRVMIFAMAGWVATSYRIVHSRVSPRWRRSLIIPLWFVWMAFGLGGPVFNGALSLSEALSTGASFTAGMAVYFAIFVMRSRAGSR